MTEREKFEGFLSSDGRLERLPMGILDRCPHTGEYISCFVEAMWVGWCAKAKSLGLVVEDEEAE